MACRWPCTRINIRPIDPAEPSVEEQLAGVAPTSQFGRALRELGVELIAAHSPQAKGRIERLFHTLQDRLVKEMRVAGIATLAEANRFLPAWLTSTTDALPSSQRTVPTCIGPCQPGSRWEPCSR